VAKACNVHHEVLLLSANAHGQLSPEGNGTALLGKRHALGNKAWLSEQQLWESSLQFLHGSSTAHNFRVAGHKQGHTRPSLAEATHFVHRHGTNPAGELGNSRARSHGDDEGALALPNEDGWGPPRHFTEQGNDPIKQLLAQSFALFLWPAGVRVQPITRAFSRVFVRSLGDTHLDRPLGRLGESSGPLHCAPLGTPGGDEGRGKEDDSGHPPPHGSRHSGNRRPEHGKPGIDNLQGRTVVLAL